MLGIKNAALSPSGIHHPTPITTLASVPWCTSYIVLILRRALSLAVISKSSLAIIVQNQV